MITWMQRHKKYLVITIWISTIAFIGAGFVGWGAYDLNKDRASSVAKVGHRTISVQEFQTAYANQYNYLNNATGGQLTQEQAEQRGLDKMVIGSLINQALLLNLADDMGIIVTQEDIQDRLKNTPIFQTNGIFDKELYYSILKSNRTAPSDYEHNLEKEILVTKLLSFFQFSPTEREKSAFAASLLMEDKLAISTLVLSAQDLKYTEEDIRAFWEKNKANYLTQKRFVLETLTVVPSQETPDAKALEEFYAETKHNYKHDDGKLMSFDEAKSQLVTDFQLRNDKKRALEAFLAFKKGELKATEIKVIVENDPSFPLENISTLAQNEVAKPFVYNNEHLIVKVKEIKFPEVMSYEMAKPRAVEDFLAELKKTTLEKKAVASLEAFKGTNIGFVDRESAQAITGLNEAQAAEFLSYVFDNTQMKGYKILGDKAVLYEILEQKLLNKDKMQQYANLLDENVAKVKQADFNQNLIKKLAQSYKIEQYYKGK